MNNNRYTPQLVTDANVMFSIPLYQRLFAWREQHIQKLLDDMREHFCKASDKPYYLGMLTCIETAERQYDLIDGQQRMTVLTLLGLVLRAYDPRWNNFLCNGERLSFVARTEDKEYLCAKVARQQRFDYKNEYMETGLAFIEKYVCDKFDNDEQRKVFASLVYERIAFFISLLSKRYRERPASLNKYFEAMNARGKSLEKHEILKVLLLKHQDHQDTLTRVWNLVCRMDAPVIKKDEDTSIDDYRNKYERAIRACREKGLEQALDVCRKSIADQEASTTIDDIEPQKFDFDKRYEPADREDSILTFPEFLLLVLDICTDGDDSKTLRQSDNLLERFKEKEGRFDVVHFYRCLLEYRLLLDYYVVRRDYSNGEGKYILTYCDDKVVCDNLRQFQSMLYVSSNAYYRWLKPLLVGLHEGNFESSLSMLQFLKSVDNKEHPCVPEADTLYYRRMDNYWFRRLDYYLWEQRKNIFADPEQQRVVSAYVFRRNRSTEHFHPQDQSHNDTWNDDVLNAFGNLALISQGFNSQQSNDHLQVKFARIQEQIVNHSLQSIKMYVMCIKAAFDYRYWTEALARQHQQEMVDFLKATYSESIPNRVASAVCQPLQPLKQL